MMGMLSNRFVDPIDVSSTLPTLPEGAPQKPSFFGHGGTGRTIAGYLGDAIARMGGGPSVFAEALQQQRQQQSILQRAMAEQQAKSMYPDPVKPPEATSTQRTYEYLKSLGKGDLADQFLTNAASGPPLAVDSVDPAGNTVRQYMRPGQLVGAGAMPPRAGPQPGAVINGQRFNGGDYRDRNNWEAIGGASPQGGATFR